MAEDSLQVGEVESEGMMEMDGWEVERRARPFPRIALRQQLVRRL